MEKRTVLLVVISVVIVATAALLLVFNPFPPSETPETTEDKPIQLRLTWQQKDTARTITVTWQTNNSDSGNTVLYDTVPHNGNASLYQYGKNGTSPPHTYSYGTINATGYIHDVELTGLSTNTTYYFICGGEGNWSSERAFKTAPLTRSDVRFVAGGDPRTNDPERDKISQLMSELDPDFVLINGDLVDGYDQGQWDSLFNHTDAYFVGKNDSVPIIPCIGNHEAPFWLYFDQFALPNIWPNNERWYSLDWGPDIHIIVLNSEEDSTGKQWRTQKRFLETDLAAHANVPWKFVMFHKNVFASSHGEFPEAFTEGWVALFDKYHVDIVFQGHSHNYMRVQPINWTDSNSDPLLPPSQNPSYNKTQPYYENGTMYLVTGGWGAGLAYPLPGWHVNCSRFLYNFVVVDIFQNGTLYLQAKNDTGETFDEAWIHKTLPPAGVGMNLAGPITEKAYETVDSTSREYTPRAAAWNIDSQNAFPAFFTGIALSCDDLRRKTKLIRRRLSPHSKLNRV